MRVTFICTLIILVCCFDGYAGQGLSQAKQNDTTFPAAGEAEHVQPVDSVAIALAKRRQFMEDSIAMFYLKPDPKYAGQLSGRLFNDSLFSISFLFQIHEKPKADLRIGRIRKFRDPWIIETILGLLLYTALLNLFFSKEIKNVMRSFYNKQALAQVDKEGGLINSWASAGLFILFNLTFGLVLSEITGNKKIYYNIGGFDLFITLSAVTGVLFVLKIIVLKFIGFVFDSDRLVSQYISIINLTYFNITFLLLGFVVCYSLLDSRFIPFLEGCTLVFVTIVFLWQYLRNSVNVISNFRFHKFYLFIYLCALEICPILILIKALDI